IRDDGFRERVDRVGLVTGTIADDAKRALETVCEWARDTATPGAFAARFGEGGPSGRQHRAVLAAIREILGGGPAGPAVVDAGAPSLRRDLDRLAEEARLSLADIPSDVDGHVVARPTLLAQAEVGLLDRPFLQLAGLPGSGKSAVLRELAEARLRSGPALVLK